MPDTVDWLHVGDFNLYRNPEDRNRPGADFAEMLLFNDAISYLGLVELSLKGRRFTWTNKQHPPVLERLDWFFTSANWVLSYPNCCVSTLSMETSDHVPCVVFIGTSIPSRHLFRFENYWLTHEDFKAQVQVGWLPGQVHSDPAKNIIAKFKYLLHRIKLVLDLLNSFEEFRDLSLIEWNFHAISEKKLVFLLQQ